MKLKDSPWIFYPFLIVLSAVFCFHYLPILNFDYAFVHHYSDTAISALISFDLVKDGKFNFFAFACLVRSASAFRTFLLGIAIGLGLWMNQTVLFVVLPIALYFYSRSGTASYLASEFDFKNRILLRRFALPALARRFLLV